MISGKPLSGPIVSGRPVRWPGPRPVPPGSAIPPTTPPPDPGPITPGPRGEPPPKTPPDPGPIVTPYPPGPTPPNPGGSTGIAPHWSDACVLTQHYGGVYRVRVWVRGALVLDRTLGFTEMTQQAYINECVHTHLRFAPNTQTEPWPVRPGMADSRKDMAGKERLMADTDKPTVEQEILAGLAELRHGLAVLGDQIAALTARLDAAPAEPPAPEDPEEEFWIQLCSAPIPDPVAFEPEVFTAYERGRVLYQWMAQYTPLGVRVYFPVEPRMAYIRTMQNPQSPEARLFIDAGVERETAAYAILSGRMDVLFDAMAFATRKREKALELVGKSAEQLFQQDIADARQGGTPSGNEG